MISKSIGGKTKQKWELCPEQLTLEQALEILNPDNKDYIGNKRGAYKRVVNALQCLKGIDNVKANEALKELDAIKDRYDMLEIKYVFGNPEEKPIPLLNFNIIKQELLKAQELENQQELLKKLGFKDEYLFKKIMQIMVDGVFYDDRGERYETPALYYDNGLCIIDADTGGCGVGIENYGKAFAREFEEIER